MSQIEIGINPVAVTSPFQSGNHKEEVINGVRYLRTSIGHKDTISDKQKPLFKRLLRLFKIFPFYLRLDEVIKKDPPDILHAHAMFFCGLPTIYLGRKYKLPVIYEVRSLWMLRKSINNKKPWDNFFEGLLFKLEFFVMNRVDKVIAINDALKAELVNRGVSPERIEVINNAVNTLLIENLKQNSKKKGNDFSAINFGYIGTLTPLEGLDLLIDVFREFTKEHPKIQLNIYGSGIEEKRLKALSENHPNINFFGAIVPDEIPIAFDNIDVIINPRHQNKLTDSVTPLKPLEAMAYDKLFIGSDVGGIKELVTHGENGFLFRAGDYADLLNTMEIVISLKKEEGDQIREKAKQFVMEHKSWEANAVKYGRIYSDLTESYGKHSD